MAASHYVASDAHPERYRVGVRDAFDVEELAPPAQDGKALERDALTVGQIRRGHELVRRPVSRVRKDSDVF